MSNPTVAQLTNGTYMRTARREVPYVMLHRNGTGYKEKVSPGTANSGYVVLVDWDQANTFIVDVMGSHGQAGGVMTRWNPEPHAFWPGLYCVDCELQESLGALVTDPDVLGAVQYDYAVYYLTFAPLTWTLGANGGTTPAGGEITRWVSRPPNKMVGESIQLSAMLKFVSDGAAVATQPTYKSSYTEFTLVHEYVPEPINTILTRAQQYQNTLNNVAFDTQYDSYPPGTVLYLGIGERERLPFSSTGTVLWRIPHRFIYRPQGWNVALRLSTTAPPAQWQSVVAYSPANPGTTWPPYQQQYDFKQLFEVS